MSSRYNDLQAKLEPLLLPLAFEFQSHDGLCERIGQGKKGHEVLRKLHEENKLVKRVWFRDGEKWKMIEKEDGVKRDTLVHRVRLGSPNLTRSDTSDEDDKCIQESFSEDYESESGEHESDSEDDQKPPRKKRKVDVSIKSINQKQAA